MVKSTTTTLLLLLIIIILIIIIIKIIIIIIINLSISCAICIKKDEASLRWLVCTVESLYAYKLPFSFSDVRSFFSV